MTLGAQENEPPQEPEEPEVITEVYELGDQMFTINLGAFIPLFFYNPNPAEGADAVDGTNLSLGGTGSLHWQGFLSNEFSVGAEVAGAFSFTPNRNTSFSLPITARASYFLRSFPFEFPIHIGAGINLSRLGESLHFEPIVKPGIGAYWEFSPQWSFGLDISYWWIPQLYTGTESIDTAPPPSSNRFGNFMVVLLSALYHF
jgi:hypothetical protein